MTPDSPKGPACNCAPCRHEAAERTAPIPYLRRHVAEAIYDALKIYNRADVDVAADAIVAMVRPELERLTAELQAQNRLYRMVGTERDEKQFEIERLRRWVDRFRERAAEHLAEVSRLREQLAAQPKVPVDADEFVSVALNAAANRCNAALSEGLDISLTGAVMDLLRSWGVSSSEVEAPQQHKVTFESVYPGVHRAVCRTCGQDSGEGVGEYAALWKDQHEADTLRPTLTNESSISSRDEGRPSGSERLAPRPELAYADRMMTECCASEGMTGIDCRLPKGHVDWHSGRFDPTGEGYESGYPVCIQWPRNEWDRCEPEHDAAQAARSEATPEEPSAHARVWTRENAEEPKPAVGDNFPNVVDAHGVRWVADERDDGFEGWRSDSHGFRIWRSWAQLLWQRGPLTEVPSPSLPKEGEDTPPVARRAVYAHPGYDYEYGEEGERVGINAGWDLAFGCRVSFGLDEGESYVVVSMSDRELRDGSCNRSVTREQIRGFAYYLIQMTEEMDEFLPSVSSQVEKEGETDEQ